MGQRKSFTDAFSFSQSRNTKVLSKKYQLKKLIQKNKGVNQEEIYILYLKREMIRHM